MTALEFTVLGTPAPQGSKRPFVRGGRAILVESSKDRVNTWRGDVVRAAVDALPGIDGARHGDGFQVLFDRPVFVDIEFRFDRPKGHYRTGRNAHLLKESAPLFPAGKPDIDKVLRSTFDALSSAGVWRDDAQAVSVNSRKVYADVRRPGATIRLETPDHVRDVATVHLPEGAIL